MIYRCTCAKCGELHDYAYDDDYDVFIVNIHPCRACGHKEFLIQSLKKGIAA